MSDKTAKCELTFALQVNCPNCNYLIDLMYENHTNGESHNDDNYLVDQVFDNDSKWDDFECEDVVCTQCKHEFNVKGLDW